ncbi:MAG: cytochrome c maturation protein CcmE [Dehalococcoidia bacterium]
MQYTPARSPQDTQDATGIASVLTHGRKLMIVGFIVLAAFAYFGYTAFQSATSFYLTVDELVERGPVDPSESLRVKGTLVPFSFARADTTNLLANFFLEDGGKQVAATYDGVLPDLFFNPHSEIVLGGTYGEDGVFTADRVLIKCPSKYQALDVDNPYDDVPTAA